LTAVTWEHSET